MYQFKGFYLVDCMILVIKPMGTDKFEIEFLSDTNEMMNLEWLNLEVFKSLRYKLGQKLTKKNNLFVFIDFFIIDFF